MLFFILSTFAIAMNLEEKLKCSDMTNTNEMSKRKFLLTYTLDMNTLSFDERIPVDQGKRTHSILSADHRIIYAVEYRGEDPKIQEQFEFHRALLQKFKLTVLADYIIRCMTERKNSFVTYTSRNSHIPNYQLLQFASLEQINKSFLGSLELFKSLEENRGVIFNFNVDSINMLDTGEIRIDPLILLSVYRSGKQGYCNNEYLFCSENKDKIDFHNAQNVVSEYTAVKAESKWNKHSFLHWLSQVLSKIITNNFVVSNGDLLEMFEKQVHKLIEWGVEPTAKEQSWKDLEEFVLTMGQKGVLTSKLNGEQDDQSKKSKPNSISVSSKKSPTRVSRPGLQQTSEEPKSRKEQSPSASFQALSLQNTEQEASTHNSSGNSSPTETRGATAMADTNSSKSKKKRNRKKKK